MRVESGGLAHVTSPKGAMGLMQLMPETWADMRGKLGLGADPYDPHDNVLAGVAYLREMYDQFGSDGFLAAYNEGPGRYLAQRRAGRPPLPATQAYVGLVMSKMGGALPLPSSGGGAPMAPRPTIFVVLRSATPSDHTSVRATAPDPFNTPTFTPSALFAVSSPGERSR